MQYSIKRLILFFRTTEGLIWFSFIIFLLNYRGIDSPPISFLFWRGTVVQFLTPGIVLLYFQSFSFVIHWSYFWSCCGTHFQSYWRGIFVYIHTTKRLISFGIFIINGLRQGNFPILDRVPGIIYGSILLCDVRVNPFLCRPNPFLFVTLISFHHRLHF